jgi:hypothetical protein
MQFIFYELKENSPDGRKWEATLAKGSCTWRYYGPGEDMVVVHSQLVNGLLAFFPPNRGADFYFEFLPAKTSSRFLF